MADFPRILYKHQDPLTRTVLTQDEQDKFVGEGWSLQARPQEQVDQEQYFKDHPEAKEPAKGAEQPREFEMEHPSTDDGALHIDPQGDHKADIVKQEGTEQ